jgi:surfactin synthase thioesterase subunit
MCIEITAAIIQELKKYPDVPWAIYGHSFGGLLGYLCAIHLREENIRMPSVFLVGGKHALSLLSAPAEGVKLIADFNADEMHEYFMENHAQSMPASLLESPGSFWSVFFFFILRVLLR